MNTEEEKELYEAFCNFDALSDSDDSGSESEESEKESEASGSEESDQK